MSADNDHDLIRMWLGILFIVLFIITMLFAISFHLTTAIVFIVHQVLKGDRLDTMLDWF